MWKFKDIFGFRERRRQIVQEAIQRALDEQRIEMEENFNALLAKHEAMKISEKLKKSEEDRIKSMKDQAIAQRNKDDRVERVRVVLAAQTKNNMLRSAVSKQIADANGGLFGIVVDVLTGAWSRATIGIANIASLSMSSPEIEALHGEFIGLVAILRADQDKFKEAIKMSVKDGICLTDERKKELKKFFDLAVKHDKCEHH